MPLDAAKYAKIADLLKQGKTLPEIAATVGLEEGDVETVISGVANTLAGVVAPTSESLAAQTVSFLPEYDLPGTHQNTFADRADAVDFITIPGLTLFMVNMVAEMSGAPDPGNASLPQNLAFQIVARPVDPWIPMLGMSGSADAPVLQSNNPVFQGSPSPDTYYEVFGGTTVYTVQFPQDVKLTLQYLASDAGNTIIAGAKMRNAKITVVTMNPSLAG